jgi:transcriptional regulator with XRE-family HTH domain
MTGTPHPVDIQVGNRIRIRRKLLGLTQRDLARRLGLTFQQVQKYESADTRVSAGRLHDIAALLGVPVACFFEDDPDTLIPRANRHGHAEKSRPPKDMAGPDSFWDMTTPEEGAHLLVELYGTSAVARGIELALDALRDGDDDNYRYWTAVYSRIFVSGFQQTEGGGQ